tara:strand:- start:213 stop:494 length:282 start_codon:yes stop_codon:yes gene_type:complete
VKAVIDSIEIKLEKLINKLDQIQLEKSNLQKDKDALKLKLQEQEIKLAALDDKVKLMNISKSVDIEEDDVKSTRLKINEYVREIDKCIALLNK